MGFVFGVLLPFCFVLSVPVQEIAWKDWYLNSTYYMSSMR